MAFKNPTAGDDDDDDALLFFPLLPSIAKFSFKDSHKPSSVDNDNDDDDDDDG